MPDRPELIIFDCDGVLVDSEPIANRVLAEAITAAGLPTTYEESCRDYVGLSMGSVMEKIEGKLGGPLPDDWLNTLQEETWERFRQSLEPVAGVEQVIDFALAKGIGICVASSGTHEKMHLTLGKTGLKRHFGDNIFSASQVTRGKPFPDLFEFAARHMGTPPARSIVVEDSVPGVTAARAARMQVFAYAGDPLARTDALARAGGQLVRSMTELRNELSQLFG